MRHPLLLFLAACVPQGSELKQLDHDGQERTYFLQVPDGAAADAPVVVVLHGSMTGQFAGRRMGSFTGWNEVAEREGAIAVYPNGISGQWNDGRSNVSTGADDAGFIAAMLDEIDAETGFDPDRVYVTGISNGGFMTQRLMCERSDLFAAGYSIAATMPEGLAERCELVHPVSVAFAVGTDDPLVPYEGGTVGKNRGECDSADDAAAAWTELADCEDPETTDLPDLDDGDASTVHRTDWACEDGARVRLDKIEGGGHTWPGRAQYLPKGLIGVVNGDIDATEDAWDFFNP